MDKEATIAAFLALSDAGIRLAASHLSKHPKSHPLRENIRPEELLAAMQSGELADMWRTSDELISALRFAQSRQESATIVRARLVELSPELLAFIDELRAEGLDPTMYSLQDKDGNPIKFG